VRRAFERLVIVVFSPEVTDVVEQSSIDKGLHPITGKPKDCIWRFGGQPVADGRFVAFVVHGVKFHLKVWILFLEFVDHLGKGLFRSRIRLV
jgi:hypothetical protein